MWQHSENDTFVFYEQLIGKTGLAEIQRNFEESEVTDKSELGKIKYFKQFSANEAEENLKDIDAKIKNTAKRKAKLLIIHDTISKLDYFIKKLSKLSNTNTKYPFLLIDIKALKENLTSKYAYLMPINPSMEKDINKSTLTENQKIIWNAEAATLGALFYDLLYECKLSSGKPYMTTDAEVVIQVLLNSFCKPNGDDFEEKAFDKYLINTSNGKRNRDASRYKLIVKPKLAD